MKINFLPYDLYDAYNWTYAAGEIELLAKLAEGAELDEYCRASADNCRENDGDVSTDDLHRLHAWLNAAPAVRSGAI